MLCFVVVETNEYCAVFDDIYRTEKAKLKIYFDIAEIRICAYLNFTRVGLLFNSGKLILFCGICKSDGLFGVAGNCLPRPFLVVINW